MRININFIFKIFSIYFILTLVYFANFTEHAYCKSKKNNIKKKLSFAQLSEEGLNFRKKNEKYFTKLKIYDKGKNSKWEKAFAEIKKIEVNKDNTIECWYTGKKFNIDSNEYNCEHIWPRGNFNILADSADCGAKSDLHHLAPTEIKANSKRGSLEFGEATDNPNESKAANNCYEVRDSYKGNIARAMFYFALMYKQAIPDDEEKKLKYWNKIDLVDEKEIKRNEKIEKLQGNRNIFIDHPEYIDTIKNF